VLAHAHPDRLGFVQTMIDRYPSDPEASTGPYAVLRTGKAQLFSRITEEELPAFARSAGHLAMMKESGLRSVMWVPLVAQGRTYGALSLVAAESGRIYDDDDLALAEEVGRRCGMAIHVARLHGSEQAAREQAERAASRRATQYEVIRIISEAQSIDAAVPALLERVGTNLQWDAGTLWLLDRPSGDLRCQAVWQAPGAGLDGFQAANGGLSFKRSQGVVGEVWATGRAQWLEEVAIVRSFVRARAAREYSIAGAAFVPVSSGHGPIGVLEFLSRRKLPRDDEMLDLLMTIGSQIGQFTERRWAGELIRELSTPVLRIADRLLLVPVIGTVDPQRATQLTERTLFAIRTHRAAAVVMDVTGVAFIDGAATARLVHLVGAARLLGARVLITGLTPEVSRTLVDLQVDLSSLETPGDLQSGIEMAIASVSGSSEVAERDPGPDPQTPRLAAGGRASGALGRGAD
jgi:anti-anti-sigma regulatory factor/transcriptional regulator with GAF, ATPase, and Fis domain